MSEKTAYCIKCAEIVPYKVYGRQDWVKILYKGEDRVIKFDMLEAYCSKCHYIIYSPEINDQNVERMKEAVSRYKQAF